MRLDSFGLGNPRRRGVAAALGAAALFGATTPFAKELLRSIGPWLLAGALYLGCGAGLTLLRVIRDRGWHRSRLARGDGRWLAAAIACGGMLAPVLLMIGLRRASAADASLLLNLEAVFTALLAWFAFREHTGPRVVLGMIAIVAGAACLAWPRAHAGHGEPGALAIAGACACWAIDNNVTRKVATGDALFIAALKGWVAGLVNLALAAAFGAVFPAPPAAAIGAALLLGFGGYGISLALYVVALRELGSGRTGAYFSTAPFIGAALAIGIFGGQPTPAFVGAAVLMAVGVWLHLSEHHEHAHAHEALAHEHPHIHDEHHRHAHPAGWDGREPHVHPHRHEPLRHSHPHFPDAHHRHPH